MSKINRRRNNKRKSSIKRKKFSYKKRSRKISKKRRHFGSKSDLLDYMGNYKPISEMSLSQSVVGMSPSQFNNHLKNIPMSIRSNFNTNL